MFNSLFTAGKVILVLIAIGCSVIAAEQANRSFYEERGKLLEWPVTIGYAVFGLVLLGIQFLTKSWFVLFMVLQVALTILQILNKEGIKRRNSWNAYILETVSLNFLAYAGYCDKHSILLPDIGVIVLIVALAIIAFLAGNIKALYLDNPDYYKAWWQKINDSKIATVIFVILAIAAVLLMVKTLAGIVLS